MLAAVAPFSPIRVSAFPLQTPQAPVSASPIPTLKAAPNVLPFGSSLTFVLDGTISSSKSKAGEIVQAHLERALVLEGVTVLPAGSPVQIKIADASPASNPDIYGYVDIYFRPLALPDGSLIPLHAPASHLSVHVSAGHESTADVENTVGDIFAPTLLLHVFRKGRNFVLEPGARIKAVTDATVLLESGGTVAVETPAPLILDAETPISSFKAMPMASPPDNYKPPLPVPSLTPGRPTMSSGLPSPVSALTPNPVLPTPPV